MAVDHARKDLAAYLEGRLPKTWRIIPEQRNYDPANKTTVIVKQETVARAAAAPIGVRVVTFTLTLVSRFTAELEVIEDDLDARLPELLTILDTTRGLRWTTAQKVAVTDKHFGYDISVEVDLKKENL